MLTYPGSINSRCTRSTRCGRRASSWAWTGPSRRDRASLWPTSTSATSFLRWCVSLLPLGDRLGYLHSPYVQLKESMEDPEEEEYVDDDDEYEFNDPSDEELEDPEEE